MKRPTEAQRLALKAAERTMDGAIFVGFPLPKYSPITMNTVAACVRRGWFTESGTGMDRRWTLTPAGRAALAAGEAGERAGVARQERP